MLDFLGFTCYNMGVRGWKRGLEGFWGRAHPQIHGKPVSLFVFSLPLPALFIRVNSPTPLPHSLPHPLSLPLPLLSFPSCLTESPNAPPHFPALFPLPILPPSPHSPTACRFHCCRFLVSPSFPCFTAPPFPPRPRFRRVLVATAISFCPRCPNVWLVETDVFRVGVIWRDLA